MVSEKTGENDTSDRVFKLTGTDADERLKTGRRDMGKQEKRESPDSSKSGERKKVKKEKRQKPKKTEGDDLKKGADLLKRYLRQQKKK